MLLAHAAQRRGRVGVVPGEDRARLLGVREQLDVGQVARARQHDGERVGLQPAGAALLAALGLQDESPVALGAQRARPGEDRVDLAAQRVEQRPVRRTAQPGRGAVDR